METRKAWERLDGEPEIAFRYFQHYQFQELPRSLVKVTREYKVDRNTLARHRLNYGWDTRVGAWDDFKASHKANSIIERNITVGDYKVKVIKEELEDYNLLRQAWVGALEKIMQEDNLTAREFLGVLSQAVYIRNSVDALARRAVELPSAYSKKVTVEVNEQEEISPDEIQLTMHGPKFLIEGNNEPEE